MFFDLFEKNDDFQYDPTLYTRWDSSAGTSSSDSLHVDRLGKKFAGLLNQGATCYLNSLLQALYMTPEFRQEIYSLTEEDLIVRKEESSQQPSESEQSSPSSTVENHSNSQKPDDPAIEFLSSMGFDEDLIRRAIRKFPVDPDNSRRVDWLLSGAAFDEIDDGTPQAPPGQIGGLFDDIIEEYNPNSEKVAEKPKEQTSSVTEPKTIYRQIPKELQRLFAYLQYAQVNAMSTKDLTVKGFNWKSNDTSIQHDVHELIRVLFDSIERSLVGTKSENLINKLYRGNLAHQIKCLGCGTLRTRNECATLTPDFWTFRMRSDHTDLIRRYFLDVTIPVQKFQSIRESLATQFNETETLSGSNQYFCETCNAKADAQLGVKIETLPPILVLSLARFEYDVQAEDRVKNSKRFSFPTSLDMAPYLVSSQSSQQYSLFSVVIHRGKSALMGHYHAYIRDLLQEVHKPDSNPPSVEIKNPEGDEDIMSAEIRGDNDEILSDAAEGWFDFDDSNVSPIPTKRIAQQFGGDLECAYMLIYRRADLATEATSIPLPPKSLVDEVHVYNEEVEVAQREKEYKARLVHFIVSLPQMFDVNLNQKTGRWNVDHVKSKTPEEDRELQLKYRKQTSIDKNLTVGDLKKLIAEEFSKSTDVPAAESMQIDFVGSKGGHVQLTGSLDASFDAIKIGDIPELCKSTTSATALLAWDGKSLNGRSLEVADTKPAMILYARYYGEPSDFKQHKQVSIRLEAEHTIVDVRRKLAEEVGLDSTTPVVLSHMEYSRLVDIDSTSDKRLAFDVFTVDSDAVQVSFEKGTADLEERLAYKDFQYRRTLLEIFCVRFENGVERTYTVHLPNTAHVIDLKREIATQLSIAEPSRIRLSRMMTLNSIGDVLSDDKLTLKEAGVTSFQRLFTELAESTPEGEVNVRFLFGENRTVKKIDRMFHAVVKMEWKIRDVIQHFVELVSSSPEADSAGMRDAKGRTFRLYTADAVWNSPQRLIDDVNLKVKHATHLIEPDGLLWLEEGEEPQPGAIIITLELWTLETSDNEPAGPGDCFTTIPLFPIEASKRQTLGELKRKILSRLMASDDSALKSLVAGKELKAEDGESVVRIWHQRRLLTANDISLKKQKIDHDTTLGIQLFPMENAPAQAVDGRHVLLFLRRRNPKLRCYEHPVECWFPAPSNQHEVLSALLQFVAHQSGMPLEALLICKVLRGGRWKVLQDPYGVAKVEVEPSNTKNPLVSDGDVFVFKSMAEDPTNEDNFTDSRAIPKYDPKKTSSLDGEYGPKGKGRARGKEQGIKIEVNFS